MFNHSNTMNSTQNSTINITQLMATTTTTNRRSRFVNPGQAVPAPEDEDIYMSLQVLQAQLNSQAAPAGTQEMLERVLSKVDKLQSTVNRFSESYEFTRRKEEDHTEKRQRIALEESLAAKEARIDAAEAKQKVAEQDIAHLQKELKVSKIQAAASSQKDIEVLRQQIEDLRVKVEQHDLLAQQMSEVQGKVEHLELIELENVKLREEHRFEQVQNNELLKRNWFLESENSKLKKTIADLTKEDNEEQHDLILPPIDDDIAINIRTLLEQELKDGIGHADHA